VACKQLVLNRYHVMVTTSGAAIEFFKGKPTNVPPSCYAQAIGIGAVPVDGSDPDVLEDGDDLPIAPTDHATRSKAILRAIKQLVKRNYRNDFAASGAPKTEAIEKLLKYDVHQREISAAWQAYHDEVAEKRVERKDEDPAPEVVVTESVTTKAK